MYTNRLGAHLRTGTWCPAPSFAINAPPSTWPVFLTLSKVRVWAHLVAVLQGHHHRLWRGARCWALITTGWYDTTAQKLRTYEVSSRNTSCVFCPQTADRRGFSGSSSRSRSAPTYSEWPQAGLDRFHGKVFHDVQIFNGFVAIWPLQQRVPLARQSICRWKTSTCIN